MPQEHSKIEDADIQPPFAITIRYPPSQISTLTNPYGDPELAPFHPTSYPTSSVHHPHAHQDTMYMTGVSSSSSYDASYVGQEAYAIESHSSSAGEAILPLDSTWDPAVSGSVSSNRIHSFSNDSQSLYPPQTSVDPFPDLAATQHLNIEGTPPATQPAIPSISSYFRLINEQRESGHAPPPTEDMRTEPEEMDIPNSATLSPSSPQGQNRKSRKPRTETLGSIKQYIEVFRVNPFADQDNSGGRSFPAAKKGGTPPFLSPVMGPPLLCAFQAVMPPNDTSTGAEEQEWEERGRATSEGSESPSFPYITLQDEVGDRRNDVRWLVEPVSLDLFGQNIPRNDTNEIVPVATQREQPLLDSRHGIKLEPGELAWNQGGTDRSGNMNTSYLRPADPVQLQLPPILLPPPSPFGDYGRSWQPSNHFPKPHHPGTHPDHQLDNITTHHLSDASPPSYITAPSRSRATSFVSTSLHHPSALRTTQLSSSYPPTAAYHRLMDTCSVNRGFANQTGPEAAMALTGSESSAQTHSFDMWTPTHPTGVNPAPLTTDASQDCSFRNFQLEQRQPTTLSRLTDNGILQPTLATSLRASVASAPNRAHRCAICSKGFERPSSLQTHMTVHSGEKPWQCTVSTCLRLFSVRSNLRRHLRMHGIDTRTRLNNSSRRLSTVSRTSTRPNMLRPRSGQSRTSTTCYAKNVRRQDVTRAQAAINEIGRCETESHRETTKGLFGTLLDRISPSLSLYPVKSVSLSSTCQSSGDGEGNTPPYNSPSSSTPRSTPPPWIPESLRHVKNVHRLSSKPPFDMGPFTPVSVPLPAVHPHRFSSTEYEERNSFAPDIGEHPYHPSDWSTRPVLPGPGLHRVDEFARNATYPRRMHFSHNAIPL